MVQLLIKIKDDSLGLKEWAIIEVQGDLECNSGSSIGGKLIGQLIFTSKERPILIIGYHILYGKVVENNPAIAVLQKHRIANADPLSISEDQEKTSTEYTILAVVKRKIVFRTRPKPIVTVE